MLIGGISDCRNKALMKMFNLLDFGERAGSGVPSILQTWSTQGWNPPQVEEQYGPDRTILTLTLSTIERQSDAQSDAQPQRKTTLDQDIINCIKNNTKITQQQLAEHLGVSRRTIQRRMASLDNVFLIITDRRWFFETLGLLHFILKSEPEK